MAAPTGIPGRYLTVILTKALKFYDRHRGTIDPIITAAARAALAALIAELPGIVASLNPPGPG